MKERVAERSLENRRLKKTGSRVGETPHEVSPIREVGEHPAGRTRPLAGPADPGQAGHLEHAVLAVARPGYQAFGEAGLEDRTSGPGRVWNRIPDASRQQIGELALDGPELSPRELALTLTDTKGYFVSEASVYRLLKAPT